MSNWEYKTVEVPVSFTWRGQKKEDDDALERELNLLGRQGWELVNALDLNVHHGTSRYIVAIFKRPTV